MSNLISAKISPRYENDKFFWYENDTFAIELNITLIDSLSSETIEFSETDQIIITFFKNDIAIHKFTFSNITNNKVVLVFDESVSSKFKEGKYSYTIVFKGLNTTTIVANNEAEVEK